MLKGWIYYHSGELALIFGVTAQSWWCCCSCIRSFAGVFVPMPVPRCPPVGLGFVGWMGYNLDPLILVVRS